MICLHKDEKEDALTFLFPFATTTVETERRKEREWMAFRRGLWDYRPTLFNDAAGWVEQLFALSDGSFLSRSVDHIKR